MIKGVGDPLAAPLVGKKQHRLYNYDSMLSGQAHKRINGQRHIYNIFEKRSRGPNSGVRTILLRPYFPRPALIA